MNDQILNVIMMEYNALRTESRDKQKMQFTIISLIVSAISIVFGLTADLESAAAAVSLPILYFFLLPCTIMFFGILWLDQVYRQVMIGTYIAQLEKKVNAFLKSSVPGGMSCVMNWEQWLSKRRPTQKVWGKTNYFYTHIGLGTLWLLPIVVYGIGSILTGISLLNFFAIPSSLAFAVYNLFVVLYVKAILDLDKEIEGTKDMKTTLLENKKTNNRSSKKENRKKNKK